MADFQKNKIGLNLAESKLLKVEQETLYKAVEAYSGLLFANEKFKINRENVELLERQVEADQARLERGQVTLADLAQSESSLAGAQAKFIEAKNEVVTAKLVYQKIIGSVNNISELNKEFNLNLSIPQNLNEAIKISKNNNPD